MNIGCDTIYTKYGIVCCNGVSIKGRKSCFEDGDGVELLTDNCPGHCDVDQLNADGDALGDVCDPDQGCGHCGEPECGLEC